MLEFCLSLSLSVSLSLALRLVPACWNSLSLCLSLSLSRWHSVWYEHAGIVQNENQRKNKNANMEGPNILGPYIVGCSDPKKQGTPKSRMLGPKKARTLKKQDARTQKSKDPKKAGCSDPKKQGPPKKQDAFLGPSILQYLHAFVPFFSFSFFRASLCEAHTQRCEQRKTLSDLIYSRRRLWIACEDD
jgi:hypothetical protein